MKKAKLEIVGLSYSQTQSGAYALVLGETDGKRRLPIIIGGFEAQAIAIELEKMQPSRPLTHDLFKSFADNFNISVSEILIYNLVEGIFFAKIVCFNGDKEVEIDARTSDAIALALRFGCPIYTYEFILASSGIVLDDDMAATVNIEKSAQPEPTHTIEELEEQLQEALSDEDYEKASRIRDEINKRKTNQS
ncbi:MAG: bifunctional nuclease family protein [Bacteroidota bacterium]